MVDRWTYVMLFTVITFALGLLMQHVTQALLREVAGFVGISPLVKEMATFFVAGP